MNSLQSIRPLTDIGAVPTVPPLQKTTYKILNIPSTPELLLLSSNLLYKSKLLLDGTITQTQKITADKCTYEAIKIMKVVDNYRDQHLTHKEVKQIRKDFKLNNLY
ncbi:MAG: hypothetical protein WA945_01680 [Arcobacteraceae bacterium]